MVTTEVLKEFDLFKGLTEGELSKVAKLCHEHTLPSGALCYAQESTATRLHLCRSGKVDIVFQLPDPRDLKVTLHRLHKGDIFGWPAISDPPINTASAVCRETTEEIWILGSDLLNLFEQDSHIGYLVMKNLNSLIRLRMKESRKNLSLDIATVA